MARGPDASLSAGASLRSISQFRVNGEDIGMPHATTSSRYEREVLLSKYYFVGSGIASLAGAAYLIRDGNVAGRDIVIFEESNEYGGALDAHGDSTTGYFMSGSRMFEHKYNCTADLMSFIPSTSDPSISINEETNRAELGSRWHNKARLVDRDGKITDFHSMGFSERDRIDLLVLMATPEALLDSKRITDCLHDHFFKTNFWFEWCTIFAFERWHSD